MKKFFIILLLLMCTGLVSYSQYAGRVVKVADTTVNFTDNVSPGDLITVLSDSSMYQIKNNVYTDANNMHDVITAGDAELKGAGGGGAATGWTLDADTTSTDKLVGIGTTNPQSLLDVDGTITGNTVTAEDFFYLNTAIAIEPKGGGGMVFAGSETRTQMGGATDNILNDATQGFFVRLSNVNRLFIHEATGRVGIGTTSPAEMLDVVGSGVFSENIYSDTSHISVVKATGDIYTGGDIYGSNGVVVTPYGANGYTYGSNTSTSWDVFGKVNDVSVQTSQTGNIIYFTTANVVRGVINNTGIALGHSSPSAILDVVGDAEFNGGIVHDVVTKTTNYTALVSDYIILYDCSAGDDTLYLPNANTCTGRTHVVKVIANNSNAYTLLVDPTSCNIDGDATLQMATEYDAIVVVSDGTNWYIY